MITPQNYHHIHLDALLSRADGCGYVSKRLSTVYRIQLRHFGATQDSASAHDAQLHLNVQAPTPWVFIVPIVCMRG